MRRKPPDVDAPRVPRCLRAQLRRREARNRRETREAGDEGDGCCDLACRPNVKRRLADTRRRALAAALPAAAASAALAAAAAAAAAAPAFALTPHYGWEKKTRAQQTVLSHNAAA